MRGNALSSHYVSISRSHKASKKNKSGKNKSATGYTMSKSRKDHIRSSKNLSKKVLSLSKDYNGLNQVQSKMKNMLYTRSIKTEEAEPIRDRLGLKINDIVRTNSRHSFRSGKSLNFG